MQRRIITENFRMDSASRRFAIKMSRDLIDAMAVRVVSSDLTPIKGKEEAMRRNGLNRAPLTMH